MAASSTTWHDAPLSCSIWTIDLAHLLAHYGHRVAFTTTTIGINSDYANEGFYIEHMEEDQRRVQRLFADAPAAGAADLFCICKTPSRIQSSELSVD